MKQASPSAFHVLLTVGLMAFALAALSIADMYLPRPYDGIALEADAPGRLVVRDVLTGSGADNAGIRPGDRIVGIARNILRSPTDAAERLRGYRIGQTVPYLVESDTHRREVRVELGPRRVGRASYLTACLLGFSFFLVGLFVLLQKPDQRVGQVFFLLCTLFLLFLVCRLRPASYSGVDRFVLLTGSLALVLLPGAFLHFFLIFPRAVWAERKNWWTRIEGSRPIRIVLITTLYLLPVLVWVVNLMRYRSGQSEGSLVSGAPMASWWILALYMVLGLVALGINTLRLTRKNERRGAAWVLVGAIFGLLPFMVVVLAFPSVVRSPSLLYFAVAPLILVPITFAVAIIRFQLLDIQVILRKSLLYTVTTAVITAIYAGAIAAFNALFQQSGLARSPYFPLVLALAIVLLFEPLRRWIQGPVDRFFFAERIRLQNAMVEMEEALTAQVDLEPVVRDLVEKLPHHLGLHFSALYLAEEDGLVRKAGPDHLPEQLEDPPELASFVRRRGNLIRLSELAPLTMLSVPVARVFAVLDDAGVDVLGDLSSPRRRLGRVVLSAKSNQVTLEAAELDLLRSLLRQASVALETSLLLQERTQQAELERELEIAASIQAGLIPGELHFARDWKVSVACRPARTVGGDFIIELPAPHNGSRALLYGDVSGKSVSGALLMMAAQECIHSLALVHRDPATLLELANRRLYQLRRRSFVAVGYLASSADGRSLQYVLAGQPHLIKRHLDGRVEELPLCEHRVPLGAMEDGRYQVLEIPMEPGELVMACSDGVLDAMSPRGSFFGSERLAEALANSPPEPAGAVSSVLDRLEQFAQGREAYDDMTLVAVSRA